MKFLAAINEHKLPETTPPDREFRYIDISGVGRGRLVREPEVIRFGDAPSRARRRVRPGDTIVSTVRTYLRAVWPVTPPTDDLVVSTGFAVLSPGPDLHGAFLGWCAQSDPFIEEVVARSTGVSYPAINPSDLGNLEVPIPPLATQRAISALLDRETAILDALVVKRQTMLRLLAERRRAAINREVLGLAAGSGRRTTTIPWLAEVPVSWQVRRLKFAADLQTGITLGKRYAPEVPLTRRPYLRVANVQDGYLALDEVTKIEIPAAEIRRYELKTGDVLVTEGGDFDKLGRGYVWNGEIAGCLHQNHVFAIRPRRDILEPVFLAHIMTSAHGRAYFTSTGQQTTNLASTNSTVLMDLPVPLPPLEDQRSILSRLEPALNSIDRLAERVVAQIDQLVERRRALITAAVSGRIDVVDRAA